ncbi:MAG: response regulator [Ruminococcus sp.]|nr:response regulator [Ruminococcus sp.]
MKYKKHRSMLPVILVIAAVCIAVFVAAGIYMSNISQKTIVDVGNTYMMGMGERIELHFETMMDYRLSQLEEVISDVSDKSYTDREEMYDELRDNVLTRDIRFLALCKDDGSLESIFGSEVTLVRPEYFVNSLRGGEEKITIGVTAEGETVVVIGVPAEYPTMDGGKSLALVSGFPVEYMSTMLTLNNAQSLVYAHIILRDGEFVMRSGSAADSAEETYFERIRDHSDSKPGEKFIAELSDAMASGSEYSGVLEFDGEQKHYLCTPLSNTEWYLVVVMPYGKLETAVTGLSRSWTFMMVCCCIAVFVTVMSIFLAYRRIINNQLKELEEARNHAVSASKAKSEFLSNMSHDIRTPMNAIVGMTAIAAANINNTSQVKSCLEKITMSSKHLLGLINDILDMSKIESGKMTLNIEEVSLRAVMDNIVNIVQPQVKAKNQQFNVFIDNIFCENVYCDSVRLNQVLINLLSNALKFTPEGGTIHVALSEEDSPQGDDFVRIHLKVKDNGIGIAPEFKDKIFESFTREDGKRVHKIEGSGLGMAITKYIVDAMGGVIELESEQGKGTEFRITADFEKVTELEDDMLLPDWNMLVVDDDEQLCKSAAGSLMDIGIKAEWTLNGESALEMIENRHKKNDDYRIILLDWKLPGIDGIETARRIRSLMGGDIPILLISAYDWSDIEEEAREAGINGFIGKPLFKSTMYYGLRQFMGVEDRTDEQKTESGGLAGKRILVAEDNDLNWEIAEALLSALGPELEWAQNGRICLDKFTASPEGYYDAILMDIRMPVMSGYEAASAIRALDRKDAGRIPIIAMTADAFTDDIKHCLACGMNAHIAKPIDISEVAKTLGRAIDEIQESN